jgi:hypothetical protein
MYLLDVIDENGKCLSTDFRKVIMSDWDKLVKFFKEYNEKVFIEKDRIITGNYLETIFYKGNTFKDVGYIDFGFDNIYRNISHKDMLKLAKILFKYDKV